MCWWGRTSMIILFIGFCLWLEKSSCHFRSCESLIPDKESDKIRRKIPSRSRIPRSGTFSLGPSFCRIHMVGFEIFFSPLSLFSNEKKIYDQGQHPIPSTIGRLELAWREVPSRIFKDEKDRKPVDSDAWWEKWVGILPCPPSSNPVGGQPHGIGYLPSLVLPILDLY